jgi:hypothetical protein
MTFPGLQDGKLFDANYTLLITAAGITDGFGNALDGDRNGTAGGDASIPFYVLQGDTQLAFDGTPRKDRKIDFVDYQIMSRNFGMTNPSAADGDFTLDGVINNDDFMWLRQRFGNTLAPPPPPAPPVSSPTPTPTPVKPVPKPAPKPVAAKQPSLGSSGLAAAAALAPTNTVVAKPVAPAKFATKKIGSKDLLA